MTGDFSAAKTLDTGGAGYVGNHAVRAFLEADYDVLVLDNLSTGFSFATGDAELVGGDGRGWSNRKVIEMVKEVSGVDFDVQEGPRRQGDPAKLAACSDRIKAIMGWTPHYDDLRVIVQTAWCWEEVWQERKLDMTDHVALSHSA